MRQALKTSKNNEGFKGIVLVPGIGCAGECGGDGFNGFLASPPHPRVAGERRWRVNHNRRRDVFSFSSLFIAFCSCLNP